MHITENIDIYQLIRKPLEPLLREFIPRYFYEDYDDGIFDLGFADKVIRRCKKSLYFDYKDESLHFSGYYGQTMVRSNFYQNQIQEEVNALLHDQTVMVTFDGPNGAGKSNLVKLLEWFILSLDQRFLYGQNARISPKVSAAGAESIQPQLDYHAKKVRDRERREIASLDFFGHLLQYAQALTRYAAERSPVQFVDRSYLTSVAKASDFIEQRQKEIHKRNILLLPEKFAELEYLIDHMKDKYVVPDLSVILLCDQQTSRKRQKSRSKRSKDVDPREIGWYYFFQQQQVIPNAIYIDTISTNHSNAFCTVINAIKERCEDKGGKHAEFAQKITPLSIEHFLASEPVASIIHP